MVYPVTIGHIFTPTGSDDTSATESDDVLDIGFKQEYACKKCRFQTYIHFKYHRHLLEHSDGAAVECPYCTKTIAIFVAKDGRRNLYASIWICMDLYELCHQVVRPNNFYISSYVLFLCVCVCVSPCVAIMLLYIVI